MSTIPILHRQVRMPNLTMSLCELWYNVDAPTLKNPYDCSERYNVSCSHDEIIFTSAIAVKPYMATHIGLIKMVKPIPAAGRSRPSCRNTNRKGAEAVRLLFVCKNFFL
jgi:hypothetical protein